MLKLAVFMGAGVLSFLITFSFFARDEIADQVSVKLESGFVEQCVTHLKGSIPNPDRAGDVCKCMKADFAAHGYTLTDTFGSDYPQMTKITRSCVALYN
jgi:hypothetical protein